MGCELNIFGFWSEKLKKFKYVNKKIISCSPNPLISLVYFKPDISRLIFELSIIFVGLLVHHRSIISVFAQVCCQLEFLSARWNRSWSSGRLYVVHSAAERCVGCLRWEKASFKRPRLFVVQRKRKAGAALRVSSFFFCCRRENCVWKLPLLSGTLRGGGTWRGRCIIDKV